MPSLFRRLRCFEWRRSAPQLHRRGWRDGPVLARIHCRARPRDYCMTVEHPDIHIRPARRNDSPAILAVNRAGVPGVTLLEPADRDELFQPACHLWVAQDRGEITAYLAAFPSGTGYTGEEFLWSRQRYPSFLYIDQAAVAETHRRRGIASRLYREVESFARKRRIPRLTCEINVRPPNPVSREFHRAQGYVEVGALQVSDGRLVSLLVRELEL